MLLLGVVRGGEQSRAGSPVRCFVEVGGEGSGEKVGEPEPSGGNLRRPLVSVKNEPRVRENSATVAQRGNREDSPTQGTTSLSGLK